MVKLLFVDLFFIDQISIMTNCVALESMYVYILTCVLVFEKFIQRKIQY